MVGFDGMKVVGLTGTIGSGKSFAAGFWREKFAVDVLNADLVGRELLEPGRPGWVKILSFAGHFIQPDQSIDTIGLRAALFHDKCLRAQLEQELHPLIKEDIFRRVSVLRLKRSAARVLIEVPLLYEAGWDCEFSEIVVVYVDVEQGVRRVMDRDLISRDQALLALQSQWASKEKVLRADHVIDTSNGRADTLLQLLHLGRVLWP